MTTMPVARSATDGRFAALVARVLVGGMFVLTAIGKVRYLPEFVKEVRAYQMIPLEWTNSVAYVLPWVELVAGLLLLACLWRREARFVIAALLVVFTLAKTYTYAIGLEIDCGCGGDIVILKYVFNSPQGILTNLVLLALLVVDWRAERRQRFESEPAAASDA